MDLSKGKWRKSSHSTGNGGDCVEVAAAGLVAVRDSKDPHGPVLTFTAQRWAAFADRLKNAARDLSPAPARTQGDLVCLMSQGKLVRDKIPQIIRSKGLEPVIYTASTEEYGTRLRDKLREEVEEFLSSDSDLGELADILEVLYALAEQVGANRQQPEKLRAAKAEERGGDIRSRFAHSPM